jgi:hypothetical protein
MFAPIPATTFLLFYLVICLVALFLDELSRRKFILVSIASGFAFGVGFLYFCRYFDNAWKLFCGAWTSLLNAHRYGGEWFDYILATPNLLRWYLLPIYIASLAVRFNRKRKHATPIA